MSSDMGAEIGVQPPDIVEQLRGQGFERLPLIGFQTRTQYRHSDGEALADGAGEAAKDVFKVEAVRVHGRHRRMARSALRVSKAAKASHKSAKGARAISVAVVFQGIGKPPAFAEDSCFGVCHIVVEIRSATRN
jgi:hypothetical protein